MSMSDVCISIDLGTTNSVVCVLMGSEVKTIPNQEGSLTTPSIVAFTNTGERLVGELAKRQAVTNPENTIYSIKRFMGKKRSETREEEKLVPYKVIGDGIVKIKVGDKEYTPPEISAMILRKLKEAAENYLGHTVRKAIITVPAYFNDAQRQATLEAAQIAGFDTEWEMEDPLTKKKTKQKMRLLNEPTSAALAYHLDKKKDAKIAVFDLGGGTFDISILENYLEEGVSNFRVLAVNGDTHLGGDLFDESIVNYLADDFYQKYKVDLRKDPVALQRLKETAEQTKKELSAKTSVDIRIPFIYAINNEAKHIDINLTRAKFEQLVDHLVEKCRKPVLTAIQDAKVSLDQIDQVVLVGGMTRMPRIQQLVKELFKKEGNCSVNPDLCVAEGGAVLGSQLLMGSASSILLLDVIPLSLGIETLGGVATTLISKNTTVPTRKSQVFSTATDNQSSVEIHVLQGERKMAKDNKSLGTFHLDGILPAPRGVPQIEISFDLDASGVLKVSAKDKGTNKEQQIRIEGSNSLSESEIERMRQEAEIYAQEDKKKLDLINAKNEAESLIFRLERDTKDLNESDKSMVLKSLDNLKSKLLSEDTEEIKKAMQEVLQASHAMSEHLNKQTTPPENNVEDAEFTVNS